MQARSSLHDKIRLTLLCVLAFICNTGRAESALNHGVVWYAPSQNTDLRARAASRYEAGVTGKGDGGDADRVAVKSLNPAFRWYVYNSATDNYVTSPTGTPEHDMLTSLAASRCGARM